MLYSKKNEYENERRGNISYQKIHNKLDANEFVIFVKLTLYFCEFFHLYFLTDFAVFHKLCFLFLGTFIKEHQVFISCTIPYPSFLFHSYASSLNASSELLLKAKTENYSMKISHIFFLLPFM